MDIIVLLCAIVAGIEFVTLGVYGSFVSSVIQSKYMDLKEDEYYLNSLAPKILMLKSHRGFISTLPFSIFSKYYISGVGVVPRWSKLHKQIEKYYLNAKIG